MIISIRFINSKMLNIFDFKNNKGQLYVITHSFSLRKIQNVVQKDA